MSSDISNSTSDFGAGLGFAGAFAFLRTAETLSGKVGFLRAVPASSNCTDKPNVSPLEVVTGLKGITFPDVLLNPPTLVLKFCTTNAS